MERFWAFLTVLSAFVAAPAASIDNVLEIMPVYKNYLLRIGATQELNCSVNTTEQNAKLLWNAPTMDGVTQKAETTVIDNKLRLHSRLRIDHFSDANVGDYKCSLEREGELISEAVIHLKAVKGVKGDNKVLATSSSGRLNHRHIRKKSEPIFVLGMKTAMLSCDIETGFNQQWDHFVIWIKNDNFVNSRQDSHRFQIEVANNSLIIHKPTREDAGLYLARFSIPGRSHPYDCHVHFLAEPMVQDFGKSKNLTEGDDLELRCDVKDYPDAVVTWYKNTRIVNASTQDGNHVTLQDQGKYKNARLLIRHVSYNDTGDYICKAYIASASKETISEKITVTLVNGSHRFSPVPIYYCVLLLAVVETIVKLRSG